MKNDDFDREWDLMNKQAASIWRRFWILWIFGAILSLGFVGVIIWALIRLVLRYT